MKKLGRHTVEAEGFYAFKGYLFIYLFYISQDKFFAWMLAHMACVSLTDKSVEICDNHSDVL